WNRWRSHFDSIGPEGIFASSFMRLSSRSRSLSLDDSQENPERNRGEPEADDGRDDARAATQGVAMARMADAERVHDARRSVMEMEVKRRGRDEVHAHDDRLLEAPDHVAVHVPMREEPRMRDPQGEMEDMIDHVGEERDPTPQHCPGENRSGSVLPHRVALRTRRPVLGG